MSFNLNEFFFFPVQAYETVNHEIDRCVNIFWLGSDKSAVIQRVLCLRWRVLILLTGPLRAVVVLLLVGLTWLLANTLFGGEGALSVRHFFIGKRSL